MKIRNRTRRGAALVALLAVTGGLAGCANDAAASTPQPKPVNVGGTWVYKVNDTNEVLHLRQHKNGSVGGSGFSDRKIAHGKTAHSAIGVTSGRLRNGTLSLSLYITQVNWGSGLTIVENLRCSPTAKALHCRMDAPIYRVHNVKQDFTRHA